MADTTIVFDVLERRTEPAIGGLTGKQFTLLLYLALRMTDGSDGWVSLAEIVSKVALWRQKESSAGREIWRFLDGPISRLIAFGQSSTKGPYRLSASPRFIPSRDAALSLISSQLSMPHRRSTGRARTRQVTASELNAFDMLVQRGVYLPAVVDLIYERLSKFEALPPLDRLTALRILVTLRKNRGETTLARNLAKKALGLARRLRRVEDEAYLLDQIGGTWHIEGRSSEAISTFEEEVKLLDTWNVNEGKRHLVGAYRGLAFALQKAGRRVEARAAINRSIAFAKEVGDAEGLRLASLVDRRLSASERGASTSDIGALPTEHLIGRVMELNATAVALLASGNVADGKRLLAIALQEANRLGLENERRKAMEAASHYGIIIDEQ